MLLYLSPTGKLDLIEKYGSGIKRVINYFKEAKLPSPIFQNQVNGFLVIVYANKIG